jgi:hypothetical protein
MAWGANQLQEWFISHPPHRDRVMQAVFIINKGMMQLQRPFGCRAAAPAAWHAAQHAGARRAAADGLRGRHAAQEAASDVGGAAGERGEQLLPAYG